MEYEKGKKPTWNEILETRRSIDGWGKHVDSYIPITESLGYKLICFNDVIWENVGHHFQSTGWQREEIETT